MDTNHLSDQVNKQRARIRYEDPKLDVPLNIPKKVDKVYLGRDAGYESRVIETRRNLSRILVEEHTKKIALESSLKKGFDHSKPNIQFNFRLNWPKSVFKSDIYNHCMDESNRFEDILTLDDIYSLKSKIEVFLLKTLNEEEDKLALLEAQLIKMIDQVIDSQISEKKNDESGQEQLEWAPKCKLRIGTEEELLGAVNNFQFTAWENVRPSDFVNIVTRNKLLTVALQLHVCESPFVKESLIRMVSYVKHRIDKDRYGCYLIAKLAMRFPHFRSLYVEYAISDLFNLARNQNSSRTLQRICRDDEGFRLFCLEKLNSNWNTMTSNISIIFLLTACLEKTQNNSASFLKIGNSLKKRFSSMSNSKSYKRVVVSYVEYCSVEELTEFYNLIKFKTSFIKRMDDKYMVYIFSVFLAREYEDAIYTLESFIKTSLPDLLSTDFFKFLLHKIISINKIGIKVRTIAMKNLEKGLYSIAHDLLTSQSGRFWKENYSRMSPSAGLTNNWIDKNTRNTKERPKSGFVNTLVYSIMYATRIVIQSRTIPINQNLVYFVHKIYEELYSTKHSTNDKCAQRIMPQL